MLALQSGTPLLDARPVFPADLTQAVLAAVASGVAEIWLMSTPLQLRAFHRELRALPGVRRVITATMPLERDLARAVERDWQVPVDEIFGCTEGGILATRRPVQSRHFVARRRIRRSRRSAHGAPQVSGGHLPEALPLSDRLLPEVSGFGGAGRFEVLGRDDDMVKIAGKRASLQALNRELLAVAGRRRRRPVSAVRRCAAAGGDRRRTRSNCAMKFARAWRGSIRPSCHARSSSSPCCRATRTASCRSPTCVRCCRRARRSGRAARIVGRSRRERGDSRRSSRVCRTFPGRPIVPGVVLLELVEALLARNGYRVRECPQVKFLIAGRAGRHLWHCASRSRSARRRALRSTRRQERRRSAGFVCEFQRLPLTTQPAWLAQRERGSRPLIWLIVKVTLLLGRGVGPRAALSDLRILPAVLGARASRVARLSAARASRARRVGAICSRTIIASR